MTEWHKFEKPIPVKRGEEMVIEDPTGQGRNIRVRFPIECLVTGIAQIHGVVYESSEKQCSICGEMVSPYECWEKVGDSNGVPAGTIRCKKCFDPDNP